MQEFGDNSIITLNENKESYFKELKSPFNYSHFWSYIDEDFFKQYLDTQYNKLNQLLYKNEKINLTFKKKEKDFEVLKFKDFLKKSNLKIKIINENKKKNLQNNSITNEINLYSNFYSQTFNKNKEYKQILLNKFQFEKKEKKILKSLLFNTKITQIRLKNLSEYIYKLQMEQFAENISRIQCSKDKKNYYITFTSSEKIPSIVLSKNQYEELINFRKDISNSITESFIVKEPIINPSINTNLKIIKKKSEKETIGKFYVPFYNECHICKLKKMSDELIKCNNSENVLKHTKKITNKNTDFYMINNGTLIVKDKIYLLLNYDGNVKDLIDNYFVKINNNKFKCDKYFCKNCLKSNFEITIDNKSNEKNFICPCCQSKCLCSRCLRREELMKQIASYITLGGKEDNLYNFLKNKNNLIEILKDHILLSKFIIFNLSSSNKEKVNVDKNNLNLILEYKEKIIEYQKYLANIFEKIKIYKDLEDINENIFKDIKENKINFKYYKSILKNIYKDNINKNKKEKNKYLRKKRKK